MEMSNWKGAAGICVNERGKVLVVLQGPPDEEKKWSVPSGGSEADESLAETCVRECRESTGAEVRIVKELGARSGSYEEGAVSFELHYFLVEQTGGEIQVLEGDPWISEIAWKTADELDALDFASPDEAEWIKRWIV